jgi:hypothetical protein
MTKVIFSGLVSELDMMKPKSFMSNNLSVAGRELGIEEPLPPGLMM